MMDQNFTYSFLTSAKAGEVFNYVAEPRNWWVGLLGEAIEGKSGNINDEFSFTAGDGVHYSHQKLTEFIAGKKIGWLVTESNLSFLVNTNEWAGTKICFYMEEQNNQTKITFVHQGLTPGIECYGSCSGAWTQYLQNLEKHFK